MKILTLMRAVVIAAAVAASGAAHATSLVGDNSGNGGFMSMDVTTGFQGTGSGPADVLNSKPFLGGVEPFGVGAPSFLLAPGTQTIGPAGTTSPGKNEATITPEIGFVFGSPYGAAPNDVLSFRAAGAVSAETAQNSAGNDADAVVSYKGSFGFFLDSILVPTGAIAGAIVLPSLRMIDSTFENLFRLSVLENGAAIATLTGVDTGPVSGLSVDVRADNFYSIELEYQATALFGTDPPFSFDLDIDLLQVVTVAEPGGATALIAGVVLIAAVRRRRG